MYQRTNPFLEVVPSVQDDPAGKRQWSRNFDRWLFALDHLQMLLSLTEVRSWV